MESGVVLSDEVTAVVMLFDGDDKEDMKLLSSCCRLDRQANA